VTDTAGRLLRLLPLLTARPSWRGDELAARLGVTTRTVRRDIDRLRELGYPVHATPGRRGGYALGPGGTRLPPLLLDEDSAVAVALGLRAAAADPALRGSQEAAARAAAAIDQVLPPRLRRRVEALTVATVPLVPAEPSIEPNDLALVALTCQQSERLRFRYRNGSGQDSRRHVEPYRLVYTGRRWYLVAHDLDKGEWRSFRLDRMEDIRPTGARSHPADPPDAARFVSEGLSSGPYRWRARVLLDAAGRRGRGHGAVHGRGGRGDRRRAVPAHHGLGLPRHDRSAPGPAGHPVHPAGARRAPRSLRRARRTPESGRPSLPSRGASP